MFLFFFSCHTVVANLMIFKDGLLAEMFADWLLFGERCQCGC